MHIANSAMHLYCSMPTLNGEYPRDDTRLWSQREPNYQSQPCTSVSTKSEDTETWMRLRLLKRLVLALPKKVTSFHVSQIVCVPGRPTAWKWSIREFVLALSSAVDAAVCGGGGCVGSRQSRVKRERWRCSLWVGSFAATTIVGCVGWSDYAVVVVAVSPIQTVVFLVVFPAQIRLHRQVILPGCLSTGIASEPLLLRSETPKMPAVGPPMKSIWFWWVPIGQLRRVDTV